MQRKKSRFWLFIFSFIPGAGEMYLGFMKMGVSLMLGFGLLTAIVGYTNMGVLSVFPIVMYFYSFFHANNLAALDEMALRSMPDRYLFGLDNLDDIGVLKERLGGKYKKVVAVILIFLGAVMLWEAVFDLLCDIFGWDNYYLSTLYYFMRDDLPRFVVGFAVIWFGIVLIRGRKVDIPAEEQRVYVEPGFERWHNADEDLYATGRQGTYAGTASVREEGMPGAEETEVQYGSSGQEETRQQNDFVNPQQ